MPILQWLFKFKSPSVNTFSRSRSRSRGEQCTEEEPIEGAKKSGELAIFDGESRENEAETKETFGRACFYTTLVIFGREPYLGLVKMGQKNENVTVGCKVLPICDIASMGFRNAEGREGGGAVKDPQKRRRAASKMKELVRWAAAANKTGREGIKAWKVLHFRSKMALKDHPVDDGSSNSSKFSFRWDAGRCSTSSSVLSPLSTASAPSRTGRIVWAKNVPSSNPVDGNSNASVCSKAEESNGGGQWITSDSDFVVLEL